MSDKIKPTYDVHMIRCAERLLGSLTISLDLYLDDLQEAGVLIGDAEDAVELRDALIAFLRRARKEEATK